MANRESNPPLGRRALLRGSGALALVVISGCDAPPLDCSSPPGLTEDQRRQRRALAYVERSPSSSQRCEVCRFFVAPAAAGACGGCTLNVGSINPGGYCSAYAAG